MDKLADKIAHEIIAGDQAYRILMGIDKAVAVLNQELSRASEEAYRLRGELVGLDRLGSGKMEAANLLSKLLPSLQRLEKQASLTVKVVKQAI